MHLATPRPRELGIAAVTLAFAIAAGILAAYGGALVLLIPLLLLGAGMLFLHPILGLLLLAGTIPLEAALMFEGASAPRLIGLAVFGIWAAQKLVRRESLPRLLSPAMVQVAVLLFALASMSLLWAEYTRGVDRSLFVLFQLILLSVLVFDLASSWDRVSWIAKVLVVGAGVAAVLTVEQYFLGDVRRAGRDIVGGINRTAMTLVVVLPFAFYLIRSHEAVLWRVVGMAYLGLSAVAVAVTFSRMNLILFPFVVAVNLILMARTPSGRARAFLVGAVAAAALPFLPFEQLRDRVLTITPEISVAAGLGENEMFTFSGRGFHMRVGLEIFKDRPLLGAGYQNYGHQFLRYQWQMEGVDHLFMSPRSPHSSHLGFLANLGLVGFVIWSGIFVVAFTYIWRAWRGAPDPASTQALLIQAVGIAVFLQFLLGFYSEIHQSKIFWVIMGLATAVFVLTRFRPLERAPVHHSRSPSAISTRPMSLASGPRHPTDDAIGPRATPMMDA